MLKVITSVLLLLSGISFAQKPITLTEVDRQLLLDRLKEIQESTKNSVAGRYETALSAFRSAMVNDGAAHELYLKCAEKVLFHDEARKASEFRDWKRRHKERTDTPAFRRALRHQLAWLTLSLEVSADKNKKATAGPQVVSILEGILRDHEKLAGSEQILNAGVFDTIFAVAYNINGVDPGQWPQAPLNISGIYETIILPPLRKKDSLEKLRSAWLQRIEYEGRVLEKWGEEGSIKGRRRPAFEKWYYHKRLDLHWSMERDMFEAGDQRAAALRMLEFLKKNLAHKLAPDWIKQFTQLINGNEIEGPKKSVAKEGE